MSRVIINRIDIPAGFVRMTDLFDLRKAAVLRGALSISKTFSF